MFFSKAKSLIKKAAAFVGLISLASTTNVNAETPKVRRSFTAPVRQATTFAATSPAGFYNSNNLNQKQYRKRCRQNQHSFKSKKHRSKN